MRNWYIASRMKHRDMVNTMIQKIKNNGEYMSYEWSRYKSLAPYKEHIQESREVSQKITKALLCTDIFVLVSDPEGTDMFVELGIVLASSKTRVFIS